MQTDSIAFLDSNEQMIHLPHFLVTVFFFPLQVSQAYEDLSPFQVLTLSRDDAMKRI